MLLFSFSCPVMSDSLWPHGCSIPGLSVPVTQVQVHCIGDAIQPSHPLMPSSPSAFNLPQHQGLFQWVSHLYPVTKVLELQLQHQSFQWIFRVDFLKNWLVWSPCCPGDSQVFSSTRNSKASILQCSVFFLVQLSHPYMTTGKTRALTRWTFVSKVVSLVFNMLSRFVITSIQGASVF